MFIFLGIGFHLSHDKRECIDEDECGRSGVCSNGQCSNIDGGFRYVLQSQKQEQFYLIRKAKTINSSRPSIYKFQVCLQRGFRVVV